MGKRNYITIKRKIIEKIYPHELKHVELRLIRNNFKVIGEEDLPYKEYFTVGDEFQCDHDAGVMFDELSDAILFFEKACNCIVEAMGGEDKTEVEDA